MTLWRNFQRRVTSDILKISCQSQTKAKPNVASSHAFPALSVRRLRIIDSDWFTLLPASDVIGQINNLCFGDVIGDVYTAPDEFLPDQKFDRTSFAWDRSLFNIFALFTRLLKFSRG